MSALPSFRTCPIGGVLLTDVEVRLSTVDTAVAVLPSADSDESALMALASPLAILLGLSPKGIVEE